MTIAMRQNLSLPTAFTRVPAVLTLVLVLSSATVAEARLFWQTYGSTVSTADGCGCNWNWNQDYFVPRYPSSGHYGMFSPCKTSCTTSAACKWCHPLYPGYCGIYGPCHYKRRDHVYSAYCGCTPLGLAHQVGRCGKCRSRQCLSCGCSAPNCCCPMLTAEAVELRPLPNVEAPGMTVLGSIPVEGNELFAPGDLSDLDENFPGKKLLIGPQTIVPAKLLPSLGSGQKSNLAQP